jgi:hypothetical protein
LRGLGKALPIASRTIRRCTTAVKKPYHIVSREAQSASATLEEFAKVNGQTFNAGSVRQITEWNASRRKLWRHTSVLL